MSRSDDRRENTLPITAEIGSEGGSYADPTMQVATFSEPGERLTTGETTDDTVGYDPGRAPREAPEGTGSREDETAAKMLRHPTESPESELEEPRRTGRAWRKGLAGAAVGTAALIGLAKMRRRG